SKSGEFSAATVTVVLAGLFVGKYFAYSSLYAATSCTRVRYVVAVITLSSDVPAAVRISLMRSRMLRVCSRTSLPTSPLTGWRPVWPETNTRLPNLVAGDRLGLGLAASGLMISFFGMSSVPCAVRDWRGRLQCGPGGFNHGERHVDRGHEARACRRGRVPRLVRHRASAGAAARSRLPALPALARRRRPRRV